MRIIFRILIFLSLVFSYIFAFPKMPLPLYIFYVVLTFLFFLFFLVTDTLLDIYEYSLKNKKNIDKILDK